MKWQGKECHLFYPTLHFLTAVCLMEYGNRSREHSASFEPISIAAQRIDLVLQIQQAVGVPVRAAYAPERRPESLNSCD